MGVEDTTEWPTSIMVQAVQPLITDEGVTSAMAVTFITIEGPVRSFIISTDDARVFCTTIKDVLVQAGEADE